MSHRGQSHLKTITRARPVSLMHPIQHLLCIGALKGGACTRRLFWRFFCRLTPLVSNHINQQDQENWWSLMLLFNKIAPQATKRTFARFRPFELQVSDLPVALIAIKEIFTIVNYWLYCENGKHCNLVIIMILMRFDCLTWLTCKSFTW